MSKKEEQPQTSNKDKNKVTTFKVPIPSQRIKEKNNPVKEKVISMAFKYHAEGNISEAENCYQYFLDQMTL